MLVLQRAVRRHMHQSYFDGAVAAGRAQSGGLEIDDGISLLHCAVHHRFQYKAV